MTARVYFTSNRTRFGRNLGDKLGALFDAAGFGQFLKKKELVAVKVHWGETGNLAYVPPQMVRVVVDRAKAAGAKPFITDTNTLYVGSRRNAVDNLLTAFGNGFVPEVVGAPVVIADGIDGHDYVEVGVPGKYFKKVKIASAIHHAKALICVSHFKGHIGMGFGGTLKNIGMGCAAPSGKQNIHSDAKPKVTRNVCTGCGVCVKWCPAAAITMTGAKKAAIDPKRCIGCGECTVVCLYEAIAVNWESDAVVAQEKMAEYALGVAAGKPGRCGYFNFITQVTPDCDCCAWSDAPIVPDIGIVASTDPVAVDQAAVDLVNNAVGLAGSRLEGRSDTPDKFRAIHPVDWRPQLAYAEKIGLGTRSYKLVEVK